MSLTFRNITGTKQRRADGENLSYVIAKLPKGWLLTVYSQNVVEFKSDNTKMVLLGDPVKSANEDLLRDATALADAFETSTFTNLWDGNRRMADARERAYKELGYTR